MALPFAAVGSVYAECDAVFPPPASQKAHCTAVTNGDAIWHGLSAILFPGSIQ